MLNKIRKILINIKYCISRSVAYLSIINAGMILFLFLSKLKESGFISFEIDKFFFPIFISGIIILAFVGYIEIYKFKGIAEEYKLGFRNNPMMMKLKRQVEYLYEREKYHIKR